MQDNTEQRIDKPTPNGGAYSIAYFRDANGNPTTKDKAVSVEICEFSADDECIATTYGEIAPQSK